MLASARAFNPLPDLSAPFGAPFSLSETTMRTKEEMAELLASEMAESMDIVGLVRFYRDSMIEDLMENWTEDDLIEEIDHLGL